MRIREQSFKTIIIKSITIDNFKSLVGFKLNLAKFTCLIGLNDAGKSTILQALDFFSQLITGKVAEFLESRRWSMSDINSKLTKKSNIDFEFTLETEEGKRIIWTGSINRAKLHCTHEKVWFDNCLVLKVEDGRCYLCKAPPLNEIETFDIQFEYQGSILSQLKEKRLDASLIALKNCFQQLKSLDLLSPEALRQRSRAKEKRISETMALCKVLTQSPIKCIYRLERVT